MTDAEAFLAASRASIEASARLHEAADRLARAIEANGPQPSSGNTANVVFTMGVGGVGVWAAATAALLALVITHMQGQRVTDSLIAQQALRQEVATAIAAERNSRERFETWTAEESNTLRTFARTGVLAPMKPRPADTEESAK